MKKHDFFKRYQAKNHQDGKWRNPYFRQTPKRRSRFRWPVLGLGVITLILLVVFLFAPTFTINRILVSGTEHVDPIDIEEVAWDSVRKRQYLILPGTHRWFVNETGVKTALDEQFVFETLEISKEGGTLMINVQERVSSLVWSTGERHYFVDQTGTIIRELIPEEYESTVANIPQIFDQSNTETSIGQTVLNTNIIQGIFSFIDLVGQGGTKIELLEIESAESEWLLMQTTDGYDILFDPTKDVERQVNNLFVIIKESVEDITQINYIDLRFGDHVYFK